MIEHVSGDKFQDAFRENLKRSSPQAWQTLRLLEASGLRVEGYAAGHELILNVGVPPKDGERFTTAFTLRSQESRGGFGWHFAAMAHLDTLPDDLKEFFK